MQNIWALRLKNLSGFRYLFEIILFNHFCEVVVNPRAKGADVVARAKAASESLMMYILYEVVRVKIELADVSKR